MHKMVDGFKNKLDVQVFPVSNLEQNLYIPSYYNLSSLRKQRGDRKKNKKKMKKKKKSKKVYNDFFLFYDYYATN